MQKPLAGFQPAPLKSPLRRYGGKTKLLNTLYHYAPREYGRYHEPFCGAAHLFFGLRPPNGAYLADSCPRMVLQLAALRDEPEGVIERLRWHLDTTRDMAAKRDHFYRIKARLGFDCAGEVHPIDQWYLTRVSFLSEGSTFQEGKARQATTLPDIAAISAALQGADIHCAPYQLCQPAPGDFMYLDPPYLDTPMRKSRYAGYGGLSLTEHTALAEWASDHARRGVKVMVSNSLAAEPLYEAQGCWRMTRVSISYAITHAVNSVAGKRREEMLAVSYD